MYIHMSVNIYIHSYMYMCVCLYIYMYIYTHFLVTSGLVISIRNYDISQKIFSLYSVEPKTMWKADL